MREGFQPRWLLGIHFAHTDSPPPLFPCLQSKVPSNAAGHQAGTWQILIGFTPLAPAVAEPQGGLGGMSSTEVWEQAQAFRRQPLLGGSVCIEDLATRGIRPNKMRGLQRCSWESIPVIRDQQRLAAPSAAPQCEMIEQVLSPHALKLAGQSHKGTKTRSR